VNKNVKQYLKVILNLLIALVVLLLTVVLLPKMLVFFMPFVIGWIIASIANPLVHFFESKLKLRRKAGSVLVIVLVISAVIGVGYLAITKLIAEGIAFASELPEIWSGLEENFNNLGKKWMVFYKRLPIDVQETITSVMSNLSQYIGEFVGKISSPTMTAIGNFAKSIPGILIAVIMCILSAYFFVAERDYLNAFFRKYVPVSIQQKWLIGYKSMKKAVGGYFIAQFRIEVWMYILLVIGLMVLNINYAFLFALLIAVLDLLPVFGTGTVLIPWAVLKWIDSDYHTAIGLLVIWGAGQLIRQLIQPKFIGDSIGVKPIPTLFLLYIGFKVAGVFGMIIAVPIGIILITLNDAGVFDTTKNSIRLLVKKVNDFRKLDENDLKCLEEAESDKEQIQEELMSMSFSDDGEDEVNWLSDNRYKDIKRELMEKLREKKAKKGSDK